MSPHRPPALARALLRLLLPGALHDAFAGDLEERFHRTAVRDLPAARRGYWRDVLSPRPSASDARREACPYHADRPLAPEEETES